MGINKNLYFSKLTAGPDLDQLFREYYDRLVFFVWQILKDKQQSEDIVQEAFIDYWQRREHISVHPIAIKNFLYRTIKNASLDIIRHANVVDQFKASEPTIEPSETYIVESIISAEIVAEVNKAIESLPPHLIRLCKLSFLDGKKNQEVAEELERSVNTVKKQKQRALELLRVGLNPEIIILLISYGAYLIQK